MNPMASGTQADSQIASPLNVTIRAFQMDDLDQKFGFQIEGTLRRYAYRDGKYMDSYTMAWVRE